MRKISEASSGAMQDNRPSRARRAAAVGLGLSAFLLLTGACSSDEDPQADPGGISAPEPTFSTPSGKSLPVYKEKQQYTAPSFRNPNGPTGHGPMVQAGDVIDVICRVPGGKAMPESVRQGGWYKTNELDDRQGPFYYAANTAENPPLSKNQAFDPKVRTCEDSELPAQIVPGVWQGAGETALTFSVSYMPQPA